MSESIIVAVIAAGASVVCQLIISRSNAKKDSVQRSARQQKLDDDIAALTHRVNEHNNYAAMFASVTGEISELATSIRLLQKDIEYLKEGLFNGKSN